MKGPGERAEGEGRRGKGRAVVAKKARMLKKTQKFTKIKPR